MLKDICFRDLVLPFDEETVHVIELFWMTRVDGQGFTGIEESGQKNIHIYLELGVQTESSSFQDTFPESAIF